MSFKRVFLYACSAAVAICLLSGGECIASCKKVVPASAVGSSQTLTMSLSLETEKYLGRGSYNVEIKVEGSAKRSFSLENANRILFLLYQIGKNENGEEFYSETFVAEFQLSVRCRAALMTGKPVTFDVDLADLGWDNEKASILVGDPFKSIPRGRYRLAMLASFVDASKLPNEDAVRQFYSNHVAFEITSF